MKRRPNSVRQIAGGLTMYLEQLLLADRVDEMSRFYAAMQPGGQWAICRVASNRAAIWEAAEIIARVQIQIRAEVIRLPQDSAERNDPANTTEQNRGPV